MLCVKWHSKLQTANYHHLYRCMTCFYVAHVGCRVLYPCPLFFLSSASLISDPPVTPEPVPEGHLPLSLILAVVASTVVTGIVLTCASLTLSKRLFQFCVNSVPSTFHRL